jgi:hypothetical protein
MIVAPEVSYTHYYLCMIGPVRLFTQSVGRERQEMKMLNTYTVMNKFQLDATNRLYFLFVFCSTCFVQLFWIWHILRLATKKPVSDIVIIAYPMTLIICNR